MGRWINAVAVAVRLAVVALATVLLAGCVITSTAPLVTDAESTTPLPASFWFYAYDANDDGGPAYDRSSEGPRAIALEGATYVTDDRTMAIRFVPVEDAPDTYVIAIAGSDTNIYGIARYRDRVIAMDVVLKDDDPAKAIAAERARAGADAAALADVSPQDGGGLTATSRAALDYLVQMDLAGRLPMSPLVAYIGDGPDAAVPTHMVAGADGFWKPAE
jgi:hypothetical protein